MALSPIPRALAFLGSGLEFRVEIAIGVGDPETGIWAPDPNAGDWDESLWGAGGDAEGLYWVDVSSRAMQVTASSGRDRFEARFRTGQATFVLDNDDGAFSPDGGIIGDVRFRPGRWIRLLGRASATSQPGVFDFPALPGDNANRIDSDRLTDDDAGGLTITGTFTPGAGLAIANATLAGNWSANTATRSWLLQLNSNGQLRFVFQDPINGQLSAVHPSVLSVGVTYPFTVVWVPGSPVTIEVNGVLFTATGTGDDMVMSAVPIMIGRQTSGGGFFDGTIETLRVTPATGTPFRLDGIDVGANGPLDGVTWTDAYGNDLTGAGDVSLSGFVPTPAFVPLWTGYISAVVDEYALAGGGIVSRMAASEFLGNLQIDNPPALASPVPTELSSDRVTRILDLADWPDGVRFPTDVGVYEMQPSELAQSRLEEIQLVAESEGGAFYQMKDGRTRFRNRNYLESERSANVQFAIGQVGAGVQVLTAKSDWSTARVYNDVTFARAGGSAQRAIDVASINMYRRRTTGRNNLQNTQDADVAFLANRFLERFRYDKLRIEQLTVTAVNDEGANDLLNMELADRLQVTVRNLRGWAFTIDTYLNRFTWRVTADDWEVDLIVDNVDIGDPFNRSGFVKDGFTDGFGI